MTTSVIIFISSVIGWSTCGIIIGEFVKTRKPMLSDVLIFIIALFWPLTLIYFIVNLIFKFICITFAMIFKSRTIYSKHIKKKKEHIEYLKQEKRNEIESVLKEI